jgi:hypothetical protein
MLANEVHDAPPSIALLDVTNGESRHLGTSQAAAQEYGQDGAVAQPSQRCNIRRAE